MSEVKTIDYRFKILYVVGILMMLCGHTEEIGLPGIVWLFPSDGLGLALFAFASGYLVKESHVAHPFAYILKKARRLLLPYFVWNLLYGLFVCFLHTHGFTFGEELTLRTIFVEPLLSGHQFILNLGGWFVFPLFAVEAVNILLRAAERRFKIPEYAWFALFFTLGTIGIELAILGYKTGWLLALSRTLYFFPFFGFGALYRRYRATVDKIPVWAGFLSVLLIRVGILLLYGRTPVYRIIWMNDMGSCPVMPIVVGMSGIAFFLLLATVLEPIGHSKAVLAVADGTYEVMMHHLLAMFLLKLLFSRIFSDFDAAAFRSQIYYYYRPFGLKISLVLYVAVGLILPIGAKHLFQKIKNAVIRATT